MLKRYFATFFVTSASAVIANSLMSKKKIKNLRESQVIFVLGGPGVGKGTQCSKLCKDYGFVHLSAGDLLREERMREGSKFGELINTYIKEGKIVPMEITIALLEKEMLKSEKDKFLIDGFPRALDQALEFENRICESHFVLYFECTEEIMMERLLKRSTTSGRVDDNFDSILKRFRTFSNTSFPVIEHFDRLGKVEKVSCAGNENQVYEKIENIFEKKTFNPKK